jgi:hypothetical protein
LVALFILCGLAAPACAQEKKKDGVDDVKGAIWSYKINRDGREEEGQFRVYNLEVFRGKDKVGVVRPQGKGPQGRETTVLIIRQIPELNGRATLRKFEERPPVWRGKLERANGRIWDIEVEIKDR